MIANDWQKGGEEDRRIEEKKRGVRSISPQQQKTAALLGKRCREQKQRTVSRKRGAIMRKFNYDAV